MSLAETLGSTEKSQLENKASALPAAPQQPLCRDHHSPLLPGLPASSLAPPQTLTGKQGGFAGPRRGHVAMLGSFWVVALAEGRAPGICWVEAPTPSGSGLAPGQRMIQLPCQ